MLDPETLLLIAGLALVIVSVIGGGFQVKEISVPKIGRMARVIAVLLGMLLVLMSVRSIEEPDDFVYEEDSTEESVIPDDSRYQDEN